MKKLISNIQYDEYMDPEMIDICNAINALPNIETSESCCGHGKYPPAIFFKCTGNPNGLFFLSRCVSNRYWEYGFEWTLEIIISDSWNGITLPINYYLHCNKVVGEEAYKQLQSLIDNMNEHLNHKNFMKEYKLNINDFNTGEA